MKLFTALFVVALAGSSAAYYSDQHSTFTNGITNYVFIDTSSFTYMLDQIYPDVTSSVASSFDYLIMSPDYEDPAVVDHIQNVQKNYKPWYTQIQDNINQGKATAKQQILDAYATWTMVPDSIEQRYNQMVAKFAARGCTTFSTYQQTYQTKATNVMSTLSTILQNWQNNVQRIIPSNMITPLQTAITNAMYQYGTGISKLDAIKMAEAEHMTQIDNLYTYSTQYTTEFLAHYFHNAFDKSVSKLNLILSDMVNGVDMAQCA